MKRGQNFLIDENIATRQISYASITKNDTILEVGPGHGILTKKLARKANKVIAVEIDRRFLKKVEHLENVELIHADILKIDLSTIKFNKIVSNLPYDIAAPFTFLLLEQKFEVAVLMYQKEFADRLIAKPGSKNYSRLTVSSLLQGKWQILEHVPPESFSPKPKVYSSIVRLVPSPSNLWIADKQVLDKILKVLFSHRRKNTHNALLCEKIFSKDLIEKLPYGTIKVDKLTPDQFVDIANGVVEYYEKKN
jgi:16S rRNA (adenine1518-N6/adenine1519-N6)-dimethyltransferase